MVHFDARSFAAACTNFSPISMDSFTRNPRRPRCIRCSTYICGCPSWKRRRSRAANVKERSPRSSAAGNQDCLAV